MSLSKIHQVNYSPAIYRLNSYGLRITTKFNRGTLILNGVKIEIKEGDTLQSLVDRIKRTHLRISGIASIEIVKSTSGDRIVIKSTAKKVSLVDPNKTLADLHTKKLIGKGNECLIQIIRVGSNKNDVDIIYTKFKPYAYYFIPSIFEGLYNTMAASQIASPNLPRNNMYGPIQLPTIPLFNVLPRLESEKLPSEVSEPYEELPKKSEEEMPHRDIVDADESPSINTSLAIPPKLSSSDFSSPTKHSPIKYSTPSKSPQTIEQKRIQALEEIRKVEAEVRASPNGLKKGTAEITALFNKKRNYLIAHDSVFMEKYKNKTDGWSPHDKEVILNRFKTVT
jgi:hypothetical protein